MDVIAVPAGKSGAIMVRADGSKYRVLNVPRPSLQAVAFNSPSTAILPSSSAGVPISVPTTSLQQAVSVPVTSSTVKIVPESTTTVTVPKSNAPANSAQSAADAISQMSPDVAATKCHGFLNKIINLASQRTVKTANKVKKIVQYLIDGVIEPKEFSRQLKKELPFSPPPYLIDFLKTSLPCIRQSLMTKEISINGINPPNSDPTTTSPITIVFTNEQIEKGTCIAPADPHQTSVVESDLNSQHSEDLSTTAEEQCDDKSYVCVVCNRSFSRSYALTFHQKKSHTVNIAVYSKGKYACRVCFKLFASNKTRWRHENLIHQFRSNFKGKFKCSECLSVFGKRKDIMQHISEIHPIYNLSPEFIDFESHEEFLVWKETMEKDTASSYVRYSNANTKRCSINTYVCHRNGEFQSTSKGIRKLKKIGTNKTGLFCPAVLTVKTPTAEGENIKVSFIQTHMGHILDVRRMRLSQSEKKEIVDLLHSGLPMTDIAKKVSNIAPPTHRLSDTKVQDVRNVAMRYGIPINLQINSNEVKHKNNFISIDGWVKEMQSKERCPILLYKTNGELSEDLKKMEKNDFVLGFMNEIQEEILNMYGSEIISIEIIHRKINNNNIQLTSIIVKDDNDEGFPVAFLWSNRQHEDLFNYFFQAIKKRISTIQTKTFMSDDCPALYNAWCKNFGLAEFKIIYEWDVKRVWGKKLNSGNFKVDDLETKQIIFNTLCWLAIQPDEITFQTTLNTYVLEWLKDDDTKSFAMYFIKNYQNRVEQWAACYTKDAKINVNMMTEDWHNDLKRNIEFSSSSVKEFDKYIYNLMQSLQMKIINRLSSLPKEKLISIKHEHNIAKKHIYETSVLVLDHNKWDVSDSCSEEMYEVTRNDVSLNHKCNIKCDKCSICLHQFLCPCFESAIKYNICKHIHALALKECVVKNDDSDDFESHDIDVDPEYETIEEELAVSCLEQDENEENLEQLKEETISALMDMVPEVEKFTHKDQFEELKRGLSILKNKCNSLPHTFNLVHFINNFQNSI